MAGRFLARRASVSSSSARQQLPARAPAADDASSTPRRGDGRRGVSLDSGVASSSGRPRAAADDDETAAGSRLVFLDVYALGALIGTGAFSRVCQCVHRRTRRSFAVKIIRFTTAAKRLAGQHQQSNISTRQEVEAEMKICSLLEGCPGVLQLRETFVDETNPTSGDGILFAVFDLAEGGDLTQAVDERGSLPEEDARGVMQSLFEACSNMRRRGVVHRDIKLENILLRDGHQFDKGVMLADLGLADVLDSSTDEDGSPHQLHQVCGSPLFLAPEMLRIRPSLSREGNKMSEGYGHEVDMWSCGVVLHILLCGCPPFEGETLREHFELLVSTDTSFVNDPAWALLTTEAQDLVLRCLERDPRARITAEEALKHPWILA